MPTRIFHVGDRVTIVGGVYADAAGVVTAIFKDPLGRGDDVIGVRIQAGNVEVIVPIPPTQLRKTA